VKPHHVLLFIATVMACLAALCLVLPGRIAFGEKELRWPTLAEVTGEPSAFSFQTSDTLEIPDNPEITAADTAQATPTTETTPVTNTKPVVPNVVVDSTIDSRVFLQTFYASLAESSERVVRVLHYGDSQIEEDRMSLQIREHLQKRYGGGGVGLMPLVQTIPSRTVKQQLHMDGRMITPAQGPQRYLVHGPKRDQHPDGLYGVMGQMAEMNDSLVSGSEELMAVCTPQEEATPYTRWRVFADGTIHYSFAGDTVRLSGKGHVYGLSQESETGVIVDNIPMRGCLGTVFTRIDSTQLASFYSEENVRLIIMQFGGNAIPSNRNPGTIQAIVKGLREQVQYLRACAPQASILFIGPSDMMTQTDGEWQTYPMVPYMDRLLHKMALDEHIAYFSLFRWMGGAGSMMHWQEIGLAGNDGVHFTRSGARKAGNAVADWLMKPVGEMENGEKLPANDSPRMD
jgi:lysophospholipase L1-like esterase